jgi:hypothetical protein
MMTDGTKTIEAYLEENRRPANEPNVPTRYTIAINRYVKANADIGPPTYINKRATKRRAS